MQYPNRAPDQPLTKENGSAPDHVRYKPESGFIELDISLDTKKNIDRVESVRWGESVRKTKSFGQKSYGIAGGFERNMPRTANRAGASSGDALPASQFVVEDDNFDDYVNNFEDANENGTSKFMAHLDDRYLDQSLFNQRFLERSVANVPNGPGPSNIPGLSPSKLRLHGLVKSSGCEYFAVVGPQPV